MYPIYAFGSEEQKKKWLPKMAAGEVIGCFGLTEPDYGSNPSGMITMAKEQKDGSWVINGAKMWITNGSQAKVAVVWAKTNGDKDQKSIRGFIVPTDTKGFTAKDQKGKLSLRASRHERARAAGRAPAGRRDPPEERRPQEPAHVPHAGALRDLLGRRSAPRWRASRRRSSYAKKRVMFGRPIGGFQIQQVRLADMLTEIVKGQLVSLHLGRMKDAGTFTPQQVSASPSGTTSRSPPTSRARRGVCSARTASSRSTRACGTWRTSSRVYTYEGTHDVHSLVLGQAITGLSAFE